MAIFSKYAAPYIFVIDTNLYAGNFERPMCAYVTGAVGECEVGAHHAEKFLKEFKDTPFGDLSDLTLQVADDHGCYRPTSCWPNAKDRSYNSVAIFFDEAPSKKEQKFMMQRAKDFAEKVYNAGWLNEWDTGKEPVEKMKILGFRAIKQRVVSTERTLD